MQRDTTIALALGALALLIMFVAPLLVFALGFGTMGGGMWGMPMNGWTWTSPMHDGSVGGNAPVWFALVGVVSQVAFFALLAVGAYLLYRTISRDGTDPALEELRRAYARGDIDEEEYDRRRERLVEDR